MTRISKDAEIKIKGAEIEIPDFFFAVRDYLCWSHKKSGIWAFSSFLSLTDI
jgi:hypothetical protein